MREMINRFLDGPWSKGLLWFLSVTVLLSQLLNNVLSPLVTWLKHALPTSLGWLASIASGLAVVVSLVSPYLMWLLGALLILTLLLYQRSRQRQSSLATSLSSLQEEHRSTEFKLEEALSEIRSLNSPGEVLDPWTPTAIYGKTLEDCDPLRALVVNLPKPYTISFELHPQDLSQLWRAGVVFFQQEKRSKPAIVFHAANMSCEYRGSAQLLLAYWAKGNLVDWNPGGTGLRPKRYVEPLFDDLVFRLSFRQSHLVLSLGRYAWRLSDDDVTLSEIAVPHLAQWNKEGWVQAHFTCIRAKQETAEEAALMDDLCAATRRLTDTIKIHPREVLEAKQTILRMFQNQGDYPENFRPNGVASMKDIISALEDLGYDLHVADRAFRLLWAEGGIARAQEIPRAQEVDQHFRLPPQ